MLYISQVMSNELVDQQCTNSDSNKENNFSNDSNRLSDNSNENASINAGACVETNGDSEDKVDSTALTDKHLDINLDVDKSENRDNVEQEPSGTCMKPEKREKRLVDAKLRTGSSESVNSSGSLAPLKTEIKRIENSSSERISTGIDALNENLYNLNSLIKLQKDVDNLKRENVVKNDIMKKLSLKEQWLNQDTSATILNSVNQALRSSKLELEQMEEVANESEEPMKQKMEGGSTEALEMTKTNSDTNGGQTNTSENSVDPEELEIEKLVLNAMDEIKDDLNKTKVEQHEERDLGKLFYDVENNERKMNKTLKNIEVKNFSDTMDTIKSQMTSPKISKQSSCDLSKYFPNQKQNKVVSAATNKNQKSLKDVNLAQYFSQSPNSARKEKKVQPATIVTPSSPNSQKRPIPLQLFGAAPEKKPSAQSRTTAKKNVLAKQNSKSDRRDSSDFDSIDQLDGSIDLKKAKPLKKDTLDVPASGVKRRTKNKAATSKSFQIVTDHDLEVDPDEEIFEEILNANCSRPSSAEYRRLFEDEKSPGEDITEKLESLLEEEERARQQGKMTNPRKKKMSKAKSLGDEPKRSKVESLVEEYNRRDSKPDCTAILTDLEKTMAFLKEGWKTEATKFLESKRDSFFSKRKNGHVEDETKPLKDSTSSFEKFFSASKTKPGTTTAPKSPVSKKRLEKQKSADQPEKSNKNSSTKKTQPSSPSSKKRLEKQKPKKDSTSKNEDDGIKPKTDWTKKLPYTSKNEEIIPSVQESEVHYHERVPSDFSDLSMDVSDREIDKILDELTQDLDELDKIESRLQRKESLPDVVKSGKLSTSFLDESRSSKGTESLESTREELDLLEKGELGRRVAISGNELSNDRPATETENNLRQESETKEVHSEEKEVVREDSRIEEKSEQVPLVEDENVFDEVESNQFERGERPGENIVKRRDSSSGSLSLNFSYTATSESSQDKVSIPVDSKPIEEPGADPIVKNTSRDRTVTSEDDSIDALFNQLTDDMLVGVEFDSSDELVRIIPHGKLDSDEIDKNSESIDEALNLASPSSPATVNPIKYFEICERETSDSSGKHFPVKPVRRNKSMSSSPTPDMPIVPVRVRKVTLPKLNPVDMAPSIQEILHKAQQEHKKPPVPAERTKRRSGHFPLRSGDDEDYKTVIKPLQNGDSVAEKKEVSSVETSKKPQVDKEEEEFKDLSDAKLEKTKPALQNIQNQDLVFENRKDQDAYIEELEKERRAALRKRDEMYAKENGALTLPVFVPPAVELDTEEMHPLSSSPLKSSYSSIPHSIASSNDSIPFASAQDVSIPQRPSRYKSSNHEPHKPVDASTHLLLERSKMLHNRKQDFMNEKIVGNNPYLKKVLDEDKRSQESLDKIDSRGSPIDDVELRSQHRSYRKFPTLRSLGSDRGRDRHGSSESVDRNRKTYSLANTLGPRNFVEYFKRSPSKPKDNPRDSSKERRDTSKESCVVS